MLLLYIQTLGFSVNVCRELMFDATFRGFIPEATPIPSDAEKAFCHKTLVLMPKCCIKEKGHDTAENMWYRCGIDVKLYIFFSMLYIYFSAPLKLRGVGYTHWSTQLGWRIVYMRQFVPFLIYNK